MNNPSSSAVVICLPAMGVGAKYYAPFVTELRESSGCDVYAYDLLSSGAAHRKYGEFGYREIVEGQIPSIVQRIRSKYPNRPIVLCGHSLGGQLGLLSMAITADHVDGLVLIAAGTAHFRSWPKPQVMKARLAVGLISSVARILPWYPGNLLGFGGDQPRRLMRDWTYNATTGKYRIEGSAFSQTVLEARLAHVRAPVLALSIAGDLVAPYGAERELLAHIPNADVTATSIVEDQMSSPWARHFKWAREPQGVAQAVTSWLHSQGWTSSCAEAA